ncbi:sigma-54 dependent transcriptional regulator [Desulfobulbus sp.]|uniref:sigma-54-dependent transcriptional regulator n=1 Tax=Desulfobulbus sp. TaxID=895 RepID=UPI00286F0349|nr:sigma-54 dependent transcriptional regulator [Desulfobulbus sp.]
MDGKILIIEDDRELAQMLCMRLSLLGCTVALHTSGHQGLAAVTSDSVDVILTAINLPDLNGFELCRELSARWPEIPVVIMTAFGSMEAAIAAIRAGAYDFITKPFDINLLELVLARAINHRRLQESVKQLSQALERTRSFDELIGESQVMQALFSKLLRIADSEASVLLAGESGSGKELAARAIHKYSRRAQQPLVAINCSAMPESLLESELFGHVKGAFTSAHSDYKGLFLAANGGTLLLDEIGELPLSLQPKLLRVLEDRCVRPLGSTTEKPLDVRVIAITNRDLEAAVAEGTFREDLLYRLNVITVQVPPLRTRGTDILLLAEKYIELYASRQGKNITGMANGTAHKLLAYRWPGNVRELRNAMEHAVTLTNHRKIIADDLPERILSFRHEPASSAPGLPSPGELVPMAEMMHRYMHHVLAMVGGNRTLAAQILQIDRKTLYRKLHHQHEPESSPSVVFPGLFGA